MLLISSIDDELPKTVDYSLYFDVNFFTENLEINFQSHNFFCIINFVKIWTPPTPPRDGDVEYAIDYTTQFLYETETIPENHLPPTHYLKYNCLFCYNEKKICEFKNFIENVLLNQIFQNHHKI